jgi:hypothetical protein
MSKEQVLNDIMSIMQDIDKCTGELIKALYSRDESWILDTYEKMSGIMSAAHQELTFLYDYIKEGGEQ